MRVLITGAAGQLGQALVAALQPNYTVLPASQKTLDISRPDSVVQLIAQQPDYVIHSAAMTDVDGCARDPDRALLVNGLGTKHVALACQALDIPLIYISTNEVFDGRSTQPYNEFDRPNPISPYGYSKWAGEQVVQQLLRRYYIVRVAWLFGGQRNFVRTILRLARERGELAVVDDEIGNPTYAADTAWAIGQLLQHAAYGVYHFVNDGYCSRFMFAQHILHQAQIEVPLRPIKLVDYRRDSTPPAFGALRNFVGAHSLGIQLRPWQAAVDEYVATLP